MEKEEIERDWIYITLAKKHTCTLRQWNVSG